MARGERGGGHRRGGAAAVSAVARLDGGGYNAITSYLPGRRVIGVIVTPSAVTVGVVGRYPATVAEISAQVRAAVSTILSDVAVNVAVEDIDIADGNVPGVEPQPFDRSTPSPAGRPGTVREEEALR